MDAETEDAEYSPPCPASLSDQGIAAASLDQKLEELRVRLRRSSLFRCAAQRQRDANLRRRLQTSVKIEVETDGEDPAASQVCRRALDEHATLEQVGARTLPRPSSRTPLPRPSCKVGLADLPRTRRRRCKRSRGGKRHRRRMLSMEKDKSKGKGKGQSSAKRIPRWTNPMKTRAAFVPLPPPRPMPRPKRRPRPSQAATVTVRVGATTWTLTNSSAASSTSTTRRN